MEVALASLRSSVNEQDFLKLTGTVIRIVQNILNDPGNAKCRTIRAGSKFLQQKREVSQLLEAIGFKLKQGKGEVEDYVLEERDVFLVKRKNEILEARREVNSVMGWDVPSSSLKFSQIQGKGKFGDIFVGQMDDQAVMVKIMHPDCNQDAKATFNRELEVLSKVKHPNIVQLHGVTLTSDPTSLILEHVPHRLLDILHSKDISEPDVLKYARQLASAMQYLHQKEILHCDLSAKNLLIAADHELRLTEFGMSCRVGALDCHLSPSSSHMLNVRWMAPEALSDLVFTKHSDVWSFGVVLYELVTGGSVPYATFSKSEVQSKVNAGYQLPHPQGCHEATYCLMRHCWARQPSNRPSFSEIIKRHLEPLAIKLASAAEVRTTNREKGHWKRTSLKKRGSKKFKVKEVSYQSVASKGGGLVCIYTALVSPLQHRVVVVCSCKSTVGEATATALAKCGKQDQNPKNHQLVLVRSHSSDSPACYLDPDNKIMSIKTDAMPASMLVLCVNMPGQAQLEIIKSIRQNPAYGSAFLSGMCGYLVRRDGRHCERSWCVLDGSTLRCKQDENEGVKQFESFLDFRRCSVEPVTKGKSHLFKVYTSVGSQYLFLATSKDDMLQWVESISSSSTLDPSPMLLQTSDGAVIQTGFVNIQEFAHSSAEAAGTSSSGSPKPLVQRRLGTDAAFAGTYSAVDYGRQWTVLRSSGLVQCVVHGHPDNLFNLSECRQVKVHNPREMREGAEYSIQVDTSESTLVLKAALPTEHSDWVLSIEQILRTLDQLKLIEGHRKRESGYVTLKRLLLMGTGSAEAQDSTASSHLYCLSKVFDDIDDVYDAPSPPSAGVGLHPGGHSKPLQNPVPAVRAETAPPQEQNVLEEGNEESENSVPLPPRDLPPPLPPRTDLPPPLPPKRNASSSSSLPHRRPTSSESSSDPESDDDYVMMMQSNSFLLPVLTSSFNSRDSSSSRVSTSSVTSPRKFEQTSSDFNSPSLLLSPSLLSPCSLVGGEGSESNINETLLSPCSLVGGEGSESNINETLLSPCSLVGGEGSKSNINETCSLVGGEGSESNINETTAEARKLEPQDCKENGRTLLEEHAPHPVSKTEDVSRQASCMSEGYGSSSDDLPDLPSGWSRVYCENARKHFFFNSNTGSSTWNLQEVMLQQGSVGIQPGSGWKLVRTDDGQPYYYHEQSRRTTWNWQETCPQDS